MWQQRICRHWRCSPNTRALISLPIELRQLCSLHRLLFIPWGAGITGLFNYCQRLYATLFPWLCKICKVLSFKASVPVETPIKIRALLSCIMACIIYLEQQLLKEAKMSFFQKHYRQRNIFQLIGDLIIKKYPLTVSQLFL